MTASLLQLTILALVSTALIADSSSSGTLPDSPIVIAPAPAPSSSSSSSGDLPSSPLVIAPAPSSSNGSIPDSPVSIAPAPSPTNSSSSSSSSSGSLPTGPTTISPGPSNDQPVGSTGNPGYIVSASGPELPTSATRPYVCKLVTCSPLYSPSCAQNGYTYANQCQLVCTYGQTFQSAGACPAHKNCVVSAIYSPVCGIDGVTYSNADVAHCSGMTISYYTACKVPSICDTPCSNVYDPVCSTDGFTYRNKCQLQCTYKKSFGAAGRCATTGVCSCDRVYNPVCGSDGFSVWNACIAGCLKTAVVKTGICPPVYSG